MAATATKQTAPNPTAGCPVFTPQDFQDPTLFKLNSNWALIWGKISNLYQAGITTILGANLQAPSFAATNQSQPPPAGSNILLTRASGDALYGPSSQRTALVNAAYQGQITQPAPPGSSAGGVAGSTIIQEVPLVHSTTTNIVAITGATVGAMLAVFVTQDSTGNGQISWDTSTFGSNPTVNIGVNSSDLNTFLFVGRQSPTVAVKWYLTSVPILGAIK